MNVCLAPSALAGTCKICDRITDPKLCQVAQQCPPNEVRIFKTHTMYTRI